MDSLNSSESQFRKAIRILRAGGLVIAPTETFYGILADARSNGAVQRLVDLKERDFGKPIPLIAGDKGVAATCAARIPPVFTLLADRFWPGPLTLVLPAAAGFPAGITAGTDSIGIRVPAQSPALDLARFFRGPLTATSANQQDRPAPRAVQELDEELASRVDLVIDGGWTPGVQPSTVLNIIPAPPVMIRKGLLGDEVEAFLRELEAGGKAPGI